MWRVTRDAAISLNRSVLVNKRTLFVRMTLDAGRVRARREARLFELEAAVWIVAVAAFHRAFEHLVMEGQTKLVLRFGVTTQTKLWLAFLEQLEIGEAGFLRICR